MHGPITSVHQIKRPKKKEHESQALGSNQMFFWRMTCTPTWNFVSIWEQWLLWDYIKVNPISNSPHSTPWLCTQWTEYPKLKTYKQNKILKILFRVLTFQITPCLMVRLCPPWVSYPFPPFFVSFGCLALIIQYFSFLHVSSLLIWWTKTLGFLFFSYFKRKKKS